MNFELLSQSVAQTMALGRAVAAFVEPGDLVALVGELGAGKTQLVRGLAAGLGIDPADVASPTFVLVHEYAAGRRDLPLVHIDAYRLNTLADLESIGWDQPMPEMRRDRVVVIEWADRLGEALGEDYLRLELRHAGETRREVTVSPHGSWCDRAGPLQQALDRALNPPPSRPCPICKQPVTEDSPEFPFCSSRCRTIDLGRWASEDYRISRPIEQSDLEEGE